MDVVPPLLLTIEAAADLLGVSRSKLFQMDKTGQIPRPCRFGKMRRWRRSELVEWERAGCPQRDEWEKRR